MKEIKQIELIPFPNVDIQENFKFDCVTSGGNFTFLFKWLNDRWNVWVTLPDGNVREAGVCPNIRNWTGHNDYGLYFKTSLPTIDFSSLFLTELYLITWV